MLKEGQSAPEFRLASDLGQPISLKSCRGKTVVLYFYPKDLTSGCTQQACDFEDRWDEVKKTGAIVLGVSRDSLDSHGKFRKKYSLSFPLLSDEDGKVAEAYGVWKEKSMYGRKYMGIERTTFVIDGEGVIKKIYAKVSVRGHAEDVLTVLRGGKSKSAAPKAAQAKKATLVGKKKTKTGRTTAAKPARRAAAK